jgi:hypothetical protein
MKEQIILVLAVAIPLALAVLFAWVSKSAPKPPTSRGL